MKRALGQSLLIVATAVALTLASYAWRPDALPWDVGTLEIDLSAASELEAALWVDARVAEDFEAGHFGGAVLLNEEEWEPSFARLLEVWTPERPIVVYCSSESCLRSYHVAKRLREELGTEEAYSLRGGWEALLSAGRAEGGTR